MPKAKLQKTSFEDSGFTDRDGRRWTAPELYQAAIDQKCKPYKLPLKFVNFGFMPFTINDALHFCDHLYRVEKADLEYPVIVCPSGNIIDGWHRTCKALVAGRKHIKAMRLKYMP